MATVARPRLTSLAALSEYRRQLLARPRAATVVQVCGDTGCRTGGGAAVHEALERVVRERGLSDVEVLKTGCHGFCSRGPVVVVEKTSNGGEPEMVYYQKVKPGDVQDIVTEHADARRCRRAPHLREPTTVNTSPASTRSPSSVGRSRSSCATVGIIDPTDIDDYIARDGYAALARALGEMTPEDVIDEIVAIGHAWPRRRWLFHGQQVEARGAAGPATRST